MSRSRGPRGSYALVPDVVLPLSVALLAALAFAPALQGEFVAWDDDRNFVTNPDYRGLGLVQLRWMWTTFHLGHYIPLSWMSLGLDYTLWGMDARGYHLSNLLLHALAAVMVYVIARRLLTLPTLTFADDARVAPLIPAAAAIGALLFAVHPLRAESVAWITERRDVLSGSFALLSLYAFLRYVAADRARWRWYAGALALFICAVLSKGTALTLPALLLVLNIYPLRRLGGPNGWWTRPARRVVLELVPFGVVAVATSMMSLVALQEVPQLPLAGKVAVSVYSLAFYVGKSLIPTNLAPLYTMPRDLDPFAVRFLVAGAAVAALTTAAVLLRKRWPGLVAAWVAYVLALFPMLGFHQNGPQIAADRYTYHAAPILSILIAAALALAFRSRLRRPVLVAASAAVLSLAVLSWGQSKVWIDSEALWAQVVRVDRHGWIGANNWGNVLMGRGRFAEAERHFRLATERNPEYAEAFNNLGVSLLRQERPAEAIDQFRRTIDLRPAYDAAAGALAENNWGRTLMEEGKFAEAEAHFRLAVEGSPDFAEAFNNLGVSLVRQGRPDEAVEPFRRALSLLSTYDEAEVNLGGAYALLGDHDRAIDQYRRALGINARNTAALINWGNALLRAGRPGDAIPRYESALLIEPGNAVATANLEVAREMAAQLNARP